MITLKRINFLESALWYGRHVDKPTSPARMYRHYKILQGFDGFSWFGFMGTTFPILCSRIWKFLGGFQRGEPNSTVPEGLQGKVWKFLGSSVPNFQSSLDLQVIIWIFILNCLLTISMEWKTTILFKWKK